MNNLIILTLVTKSYVDLLQEFFLETLPKEVENLKILYVNDFDNSRYNDKAKFLEKKRLELILNEIRINQGKKLFFIDADVVFTKNSSFITEITQLLDEYDLLFQFNDDWYNFGVFAINCNEKTLELFEYFLNQEFDNIDPSHHDQHTINALLGIVIDNCKVGRVFNNIKHNHLPLKYFANHFKFFKYPNTIPKDTILFHATNTYSMPEKLSIMRHFKINQYDKK